MFICARARRQPSRCSIMTTPRACAAVTARAAVAVAAATRSGLAAAVPCHRHCGWWWLLPRA
eukprot:7864552-Alexandrium_andersonii.AAC.1